jgi:PEP-CTERM motif
MSGSDVAMLMRKDGGDQVLVLINTRDHSSQVQVPAAWQGSWFDQFSGDAELLTSTQTLGAYQVLILAAAPLLAGDYNHNGIVDAADYTVWRDGLGTKYTQADYDIWRAHFGQTAASGTGAGTSTAVPEPATMLMLMIGITPIFCRRHSKMS